MEPLPAQPLGRVAQAVQVALAVVSYVWWLEQFWGLVLSSRSEGLVLLVLPVLVVLRELLELQAHLLQPWLYTTLQHLFPILPLLPQHTTITTQSIQIFMGM